MVKTAEKANGRITMPEVKPEQKETVSIKPLRQRVLELKINGLTPFGQLRFSKKQQDAIRVKHEAGSQAGTKKNRKARDFNDDYQQSMYRLPDGGYGIHAAAFRNAMISACRLVNFKMTLAKLAVRVIEDGYDALDNTPLVRLHGEPEQWIAPVRNATGVVDLRCRAMWKEWSATVRIWFDEDLFSASDIVNLMVRVGQQVGVGEGRPDGRDGAGMGMGLFEVLLDQ